MASTELQPHPPAGAVTASDPKINVPAEQRSAAVVRAELEAAEDRVRRHWVGVQSELHVRDVTVAGRPLPDHVRANPWLAFGAALGATALVALTVASARRRRAARRRPQGWEAVLERLIAEGEHVDGEVALETSLRRALLRRTPVVVVERGAVEEARHEGFLKGAIVGALKSAVMIGLNAAVSQVMAQVVPQQDDGAKADRSAPAS